MEAVREYGADSVAVQLDLVTGEKQLSASEPVLVFRADSAAVQLDLMMDSVDSLAEMMKELQLEFQAR